MARILRFAALTLLPAIFFSTPIARADLYTLTFERSMPLPAANTFAIAWGDDGTLWTHSQGVMNFYHLNPTSGAVLTSFPSNNNTLLGLDLQGGILYGAEEPTIVRFDEATGAQLTSITGPVTGGARGITFVGGECYVAGVLAGHRPGRCSDRASRRISSTRNTSVGSVRTSATSCSPAATRPFASSIRRPER